jgi:riboflavin synthase
VNLERPLAPSGRLGGHIVQGHIDGVGELLSLDPLGDGNWWLTVRVPEELDPHLVFKGSIAIDGISLTIAALDEDVLSVTVVPHTYENTTLKTCRPGSLMNLEVDIIAKYVAKLLGEAGVLQDWASKLREMGVLKCEGRVRPPFGVNTLPEPDPRQLA